MPGSRVGTSDRSSSTPTPPLAAISAEDDVSPAAPMSWMATMWPDAIKARLASSSSFSVNGSPTWTWGLRRSLSSVSSSEANEAPWMPSRPVREPRQLLGGERGAVDAVAARARAHDQHYVADAVGGRLDQVPFLEEAHAHRVNEGVAAVARAEVDLAPQRRNAHAVAVVAHALHHTGAEVAVARLVQRAEAEAVENRHGPGAHGQHVPQDPPHPRSRPLIRLDGRWMVVGLDLEGHRPAGGQPQHARALSRPLHDLGTRGGECLQNGARVLVGAMLAPQSGKDAQLRESGRAPEQRRDPLVFRVGEIVFADQLRRDRGIARERRRGDPHHRSDTFAPETPRSRARNTRPMMFGSGCASTLCASPASNHIPWQCVH